MYIFELIIQAFKNKRNSTKTYNPMEQSQDDNPENCNHLFMPIDSSNELFACKHCGIIVPKEKLKNKNIFET